MDVVKLNPNIISRSITSQDKTENLDHILDLDDFEVQMICNIELLLKLKSSIEIARIIAASAERELQ